MPKEILMENYGLCADSIEKSSVGAGSDTYFVTCGKEKFVLKFPCESEINRPDAEPKLCAFMIERGLPVCEFIKNRNGEYISRDKSGRKLHLQRFIEGTTYELNEAPDIIMDESAELLGKIHAVLSGYNRLDVGIGENFFRFMTPENALQSYRRTLETARQRGDGDIERDLLFRIELMKRFPDSKIDLGKLTCKNTHGDFFISQLICGENKINAVIDWTTACVHPVVWEIMRSFVYGDKACADGQIDGGRLVSYVKHYMKHSPLNNYDIAMLAKVFYYQISVCDYYNQFYSSVADNRRIYLHQAVFSTKLMRWLDVNIEALSEMLSDELSDSK